MEKTFSFLQLRGLWCARVVVCTARSEKRAWVIFDCQVNMKEKIGLGEDIGFGLCVLIQSIF